ncbi:hypothetical protein CsatA_026926 [Cannabis sativa]
MDHHESYEYDVFISFRGDDTRNNILSHLVDRLDREKIRAYTDKKLKLGDEISPNLLKAIEESKLAIIIFSEHYTSSAWCLQELEHICKVKCENSIIPFFYKIDPSQARWQKGTYETDLANHRQRYKDDNRVDGWTNALTTASNFSGIVWKDFRPEAELIDDIVEELLVKLNHMPHSSYHDDLSNTVGIREHIKNFVSLYFDKPTKKDYQIIGMWGMFGIGKTTIAKGVYNRVISQFEHHYFLENVSEKAKTQRSSSDLKDELFAGLLGEESLKFGRGGGGAATTASSGSTFAKLRRFRTKVLIVLDGVENEKQYNDILSPKDIQFSNGSIIIVTSRSEQVLMNIKAGEMYHVRALNDEEADHLYYLQTSTTGESSVGISEEDTELLRKKVKDCASGVPEVLLLLCSSLSSHTTIEEKEIAVEKFRSFPDLNLQNKMRACYDQLDTAEKKIFLDIACFFNGEDRDFVERILKGCDLFPEIGIKKLIANSLLHEDKNKLWMIELLQRMGQEIVRQESENELENRSRLWIASDIRHILENDKGTTKVEGIFLDMSDCDNVVCVSPTAFSKMRNLRLIKIYNSSSRECKVSLQALQSLPNSLRLVYWQAYPMKSLPSNFAPNHLVELTMPYSKLQKLWPSELVEHLGNLKKINLSYSEQLTHISHLSENMEIINLECCTGLVELPLLPKKLSKLTYLNLNNCSNLGKLPTFPKNIKNLEMRRCENLNTLPNNISHMKELECVNLSGCTKLSRFPGISKPMNRLTVLILDGTPIKELPSSICNLIKLQILSLNMCQLLQVLPETISSLDYLEKLSICHCSNLKSLPKLSSSVSWVDARCCQKLEKVDMTTSKLLTHVVSNNDTNTNYKEGKFAFYNCPNLDHESHQNLMFEAQLRILSSAKRTKDIGQNSFPIEEICLPGNKIPDWFEYNNEGDEINVPLPWSWCNHKFLGFAFCVVVEFWDSYSFDSDFKLLCKSECIFPGAEFFDRWRRIWTWQCNYTNPDYHHDIKNTHHNRVKKSSHIFLFYDYGSHKYFDFQVQCNGNSGAVASSSGGPNERQVASSRSRQMINPSATFSFRPNDYTDEFSSCQVKCCGVRLLYDEDHVNLSRRGDRHDHILTREVSEIVQDRQNSTMEIVQRSNTMMSSSSHRNMPSSLYNNHHQITQFTSFHCFQFCPNFAEICDCLLGKRPEIVKNPCGCSQELMKMMKELKEDMEKVNSRMDRILLQQNHNRVPQPISI